MRAPANPDIERDREIFEPWNHTFPSRPCTQLLVSHQMVHYRLHLLHKVECAALHPVRPKVVEIQFFKQVNRSYTGSNFANLIDARYNFPQVSTAIKFTTGVNCYPITSVINTSGAPGVANIFANYWINLKWCYQENQGLRERWFMKKPEAKNPVALSL